MWKASTPHRALLTSLLVLLAAWPGPAEGASKPQLVGQPHAQEWEPAMDIDFLRPTVASRDYQRPACELPAGSGKFTGVCTEEIQDAPKLMTFCSDLVRYRACVPAHQVLWPNWNATAKDKLLKKLFKDMVELRIAREQNVTPDMYVPIHYMSNPNCVHALRNTLCWYNFPKCNDLNVSLPLCSSSCNEYYGNCKYKTTAADGSFGMCQPGPNSDGLFRSGVKPGPDQQFAADRLNKGADTCQRAPTEAEIGITAEEVDPVWYTTWWGISLLIISGLVVVGLLSYILIPPVLMSFLIVTAIKLSWLPYRVWMGLPTLRGNKVLLSLAVVFVALLAVGTYQMLSSGFSRWDQYKDANADVAYQFKPPQFIWGQQATKPLTNQQLRQLKDSCSCTGGTDRGLPSILVLVVAACWACLRSERL